MGNALLSPLRGATSYGTQAVTRRGASQEARSLSSVVPNPERIGYEAAALLDQLMAGKKVPRREWRIAPLGVVTRQSTDVLALRPQALASQAKPTSPGPEKKIVGTPA